MRRTTAAACIALATVAVVRALPPVVIIPGDSSSQMEAMLNLSTVVHTYCVKQYDWHPLWLVIKAMVPPLINCWCDNMALVWNNTTGTYNNSPGVFTRVPGFGSTAGVEYLDNQTTEGASAYMNVLVSALVNASYVRNASLFAAPYDFRCVRACLRTVSLGAADALWLFMQPRRRLKCGRGGRGASIRLTTFDCRRRCHCRRVFVPL